MEAVVAFLTDQKVMAVTIYALVNLAGMVIVFFVITRRGWWKPTGDELDWTTTDGCPRCNEHGPFWPPTPSGLTDGERARDLHQAWHEVTSTLLGWINPTKHRPSQRVSVDNTLRT